VGLQWGWLLQQDPLNAPAEATGMGYQRIIILFTDSLNTGNRWYGRLWQPGHTSGHADEDAVRQRQGDRRDDL
jgi:hypothetical protein